MEEERIDRGIFFLGIKTLFSLRRERIFILQQGRKERKVKYILRLLKEHR